VTLVEEILVRQLGRLDYLPTFEAMRVFTARRNEATADEIWLLEHPPVYTLGQGAERPSVDNGIPLVQADRGGEITYHGPGQVILYALVDLARRGIKVKQFVAMLESSVIGFSPAAVNASPERRASTLAAPRSRRSASACPAAGLITVSR